MSVADSEYRLFCIALAQRYIATAKSNEDDADTLRLLFAPQGGGRAVPSTRNMTAAQRAQTYVDIMNLRARAVNVFKSVPRKIMLVTRYPMIRLSYTFILFLLLILFFIIRFTLI